jgi:hypothetical protein
MATQSDEAPHLRRRAWAVIKAPKWGDASGVPGAGDCGMVFSIDDFRVVRRLAEALFSNEVQEIFFPGRPTS